jgi:hypothetical protein
LEAFPIELIVFAKVDNFSLLASKAVDLLP